LRGLLSGLALLLALCAGASAAPPAAGREYRVLDPARPTAPGRLEVIEFFYYGCPVCYEAQPHITRWRQQAAPDVLWRRVPSPNPASWESLARTYYTLEALEALERLHWPLYDSHHFDDRRLDEEPNLLAWVAANGIDAGRFKAVWHSFETRQKTEFARRTLGIYEVRGVPSFVVDGRYLTSARMAGGVKEVMAVIEYLVQRARQERAAR
jgi:thiol:disulfide interchange protein DsbA